MAGPAARSALQAPTFRQLRTRSGRVADDYLANAPDGNHRPGGTILSLTIIGKRYAEPGTEVPVVWGEHPGPGTAPDADLGFPCIRATVAPPPYDSHARTQYRRS